MVEVQCTPDGGGWLCQVAVNQDGGNSRHTVHVSRAELERWGRGGSPEDLVRRSFTFLLEREPADSILRDFELAAVQRYFPEFDQHFRR